MCGTVLHEHVLASYKWHQHPVLRNEAVAKGLPLGQVLREEAIVALENLAHGGMARRRPYHHPTRQLKRDYRSQRSEPRVGLPQVIVVSRQLHGHGCIPSLGHSTATSRRFTTSGFIHS